MPPTAACAPMKKAKHGKTIDVLLRRDRGIAAAKASFRKALATVAPRVPRKIVEQDHRAIRRRCASMAGFESFANAAITIAGIELAHRIRKRQFMLNRPIVDSENGPSRRNGQSPSPDSISTAPHPRTPVRPKMHRNHFPHRSTNQAPRSPSIAGASLTPRSSSRCPRAILLLVIRAQRDTSADIPR